MTRSLIIELHISLTYVLLLAGSGVSAGSLYRCVSVTEGTIYTDNPAQLEHCAPITMSGAVTSLASVSSGGPPMAPLPEPPSMAPAQPDHPAVMPSPNEADQTIAGVPQNAEPTSSRCPVGVNPLNPLSAPPCPTDEAAPPATNTPPLIPAAPDTFPAQP